MTPSARLQALQRREAPKASVGDIADTIRAARCQHPLVCAGDDSGRQTIVGLFASTQLEKMPGIRIEMSGRAHGFAALEPALA